MSPRLTLCAAVAAVCAVVTAGAQTPSAVHSFTPGAGQSAGQEPEYFPANVLGLPDPMARRSVPSVDPAHIASLGMGGEIVLRFDTPIVDGPGADFTVFENAFYYTIGPTERLYAEPAEVAVSRDGVTYTAWPFDSLTLDGCAGTAPTYGDRNPFDPRVSGGNAFDLAELGVDSIRFVRLRDVTAIVAGRPSHPYWDPTLSGFDLDAIVAIPIEGRSTAGACPPLEEQSPVVLYPNPATDRVRIEGPARRVRLLDRHGRQIADERETTTLDVGALPAGAYVVETTDTDGVRRATMLRVIR